MVVDAESLTDRPEAIDAVFFVASGSDNERAYARAVHAKLVAHLGIASADAPPLLLLDLTGSGNAPFSIPGKAWLE